MGDRNEHICKMTLTTSPLMQHLLDKGVHCISDDSSTFLI